MRVSVLQTVLQTIQPGKDMTPNPQPHKPLPRGTYSKIARKLGVAPATVRDVALGIKTSARIMAEVRRVRRRIERAESRASGITDAA